MNGDGTDNGAGGNAGNSAGSSTDTGAGSTSGAKVTSTQQLLTGLASPSTAAKMEAESRQWMIKCPKCGYERSVWEAGGVRYKSAGRSWQFRKCPNCGKWSWEQVYKPDNLSPADSAATTYATPQVVTGTANRLPRPLLWAMVIAVPLLIVALFLFALLSFINSATQPVVDAGDAFMTALKGSNYSQAYKLCTSEVQSDVGGVSGLATMMSGNRPVTWNWSSKSIRNGVGQLDGSMTYADGKSGSVHLVFTQVGGAWKVASFTMNPT